MTIHDWWSEGDRALLAFNGFEHQIFCRKVGSGPSMTLLHGFPSSSYDWAEIAAPLSAGHALLMPDLLGFGASDKPVGHTYSIHEQADLVEALWDREGITGTTLVTHDYADTVAQELLARRAEGGLAVDIVALHLLNGGIYPDLHRPEPIQVALLDPEQGPSISAAITPELTAQALQPTFAPGFDSTTVHERLPDATVIELAEVGHWPAIEAPDAVVAALAR